MWSPFTPKGWTAIDLAEAPSWCAVSVLTHVRSGQKPTVQAVADLPRPEPDAETATLKELLRRAAAGFAPLVVLARSQYRIGVMAEPVVTDRELATALRWGVAASRDESPDDLNLAWLRIPTAAVQPSRPRQVYAVTTSRVWQAAQMAVWRQAGLRPRVLDVRETALRNLAALLEVGDEGSALVCPEPQGVSIVFTWHGALYLDRYIELPLADWRGLVADVRARHLERLADLLTRSVAHLARTCPFMPVTRLTVAPGPDGIDLAGPLAERLALPVQPLRLDQCFDLSAVPELAKSAALQSRALVPLGATLRGVSQR